MGYYTNYSLTIEDRQGEVIDKYSEKYAAVYNRLTDRFNEMIGTKDALDALIHDYAEWKWYNYEKDMFAIALDYPDFIFTLSGRGEEPEDIWVEQFYQDQHARSVAQFIPPDDNPLGL